MIAKFYIIPDSFAQNPHLTIQEIENKTKALAEDLEYIRQYKDTNKILVHQDVYNVCFINNITISDLLFNLELSRQHLNRDVWASLQRIVVESKNTSLTIDEVKEVLLPEH